MKNRQSLKGKNVAIKPSPSVPFSPTAGVSSPAAEAVEMQQAGEKRLRALIENSSDAILLLDPRGTILKNTPHTGRVLGVIGGPLSP